MSFPDHIINDLIHHDDIKRLYIRIYHMIAVTLSFDKKSPYYVPNPISQEGKVMLEKQINIINTQLDYNRSLSIDDLNNIITEFEMLLNHVYENIDIMQEKELFSDRLKEAYLSDCHCAQ
jgi:hypothetical protein